MTDRRPSKPCAGKKRDGEACVAKAYGDAIFCLFHDPAREAERVEGRKRGGAARQKALNQFKEGALPDAVRAKLVTYDDVRTFLEETAHDVRTGRLSESRAAAIANICRVVIVCKNDGKLDEKLKDLEKRTRVLKGLSVEQLTALVKAAPDAPPPEH